MTGWLKKLSCLLTLLIDEESGKDESVEKDKNKMKIHRKKQLWKVGVVACTIIFVFSLFTIYRTIVVSRQESDTFQDLIEMAEGTSIDTFSTQKDIGADGKSSSNQDSDEPKRNYQLLKEENPDFAGWLRIDDTKIDYPVMHTPNEMQYYIRRDFYGNTSVSGTPFIGSFCNANSSSIIIYAHNMKNGTMFGDLDLYESKEYRDKHPVVEFDTPEESRKYEVVAAFRTKLVYEGEGGFQYYNYVGDMTEETFQEFVSQLKSISYYGTENLPRYGDQLLILSTCSYHAKDGRFVVVARRSDVD